MMPRREFFDLAHGDGCLEVRGNALAIALFVNGSPMSANWDAHVGSILEYFYLKESFSNEGAVDSIRGLVNQAPLPDRSLAEQFLSMLTKLPAGPYRLEYQEEREGLVFHEAVYASDRMSDVDSSLLWHVGSYELSHGLRFLLPSQNTDLLDERRILDWGIAIEGGARPTPITATVDGANCEFILDGHHKLRGYRLAGIPVRRLAITHLAPARLNPTDWPRGRLPEPPPSWVRATNSE